MWFSLLGKPNTARFGKDFMKSLPNPCRKGHAQKRKHIFQPDWVGARVRASLGTKIGTDRLMDVFEVPVKAILDFRIRSWFFGTHSVKIPNIFWFFTNLDKFWDSGEFARIWGTFLEPSAEPETTKKWKKIPEPKHIKKWAPNSSWARRTVQKRDPYSNQPKSTKVGRNLPKSTKVGRSRLSDNPTPHCR